MSARRPGLNAGIVRDAWFNVGRIDEVVADGVAAEETDVSPCFDAVDIGTEVTAAPLLGGTDDTRRESSRAVCDTARTGGKPETTDVGRAGVESTSIRAGGIDGSFSFSFPLTEPAGSAALPGACSTAVEEVRGTGSPMPSRSSRRPRESGLRRYPVEPISAHQSSNARGAKHTAMTCLARYWWVVRYKYH